MRCGSVSVGIVDYVDAAYSASDARLRYAVEDARAFRRYLALGWPSDKSRHEIILDREAVVANIADKVSSVGSDGPLDLFCLYLSGHGEMAKDGGGWFCCADARPDIRGLDGAAIDRCLGGVTASQVLVFIDCCHAEAVLSGSQFFSAGHGYGARIAVASCRSGQRAWEEESRKRSIFSDLLLRGLSTDSPLADPRGQVDLQAKLFPYLRDEVPIAASAFKRGAAQDPVVAGFVSGPLSFPVISSISLGRPPSVAEAITAGVRRYLVAGLVGVVCLLAALDLLIYHFGVNAAGEVLVQPGFSATTALLPFHLVGDVDTGLNIRDFDPTNDTILRGLANGAIWGFATHRDDHGLKPWFGEIETGLSATTRKSLDAFAFGDVPVYEKDNDPAPTVEALFLAAESGKAPSEVASAIYDFDPALPWSCTDRVSDQKDFTRIAAGPGVFEKDAEWVAATAPATADARAKKLSDLVRLAAYLGANIDNQDQRLEEFNSFAKSATKLAGPTSSSDLAPSATPFLQTGKATWCGVYADFAAAIVGDRTVSAEAEAELSRIFQSGAASSVGSPQANAGEVASLALGALAGRWTLDDDTLSSLAQVIVIAGGDLSNATTAIGLLTTVAGRQPLGSALLKAILANVRPESGDGDFAPMAAVDVLARNFKFLDPDAKDRVGKWLAAAASTDAYDDQYQEALGLISLVEPLTQEQSNLLVSRLSSISRFPPPAEDYRGEMVITASQDAAATALGRVAQTATIDAGIVERLSNIARARSDMVDRGQIVEGLAHQWYRNDTSLSEAIRWRLINSTGDAAERGLEVEVAATAVQNLSLKDRLGAIADLLARWHAEIEPTQRIALAKIVGAIPQD